MDGWLAGFIALFVYWFGAAWFMEKFFPDSEINMYVFWGVGFAVSLGVRWVFDSGVL